MYEITTALVRTVKMLMVMFLAGAIGIAGTLVVWGNNASEGSELDVILKEGETYAMEFTSDSSAEQKDVIMSIVNTLREMPVKIEHVDSAQVKGETESDLKVLFQVTEPDTVSLGMAVDQVLNNCSFGLEYKNFDQIGM